jgi:hypothetical protein
MTDALSMLHSMRAASGKQETTGLSDDFIVQFAESDSSLVRAIQEAQYKFSEFSKQDLEKDETQLVNDLQSDFINFYAPATVNPYVALAARGPWIVTSHGAVLHDNGGYGMLGGGHGPDNIIQAMSQNHVMANVMTASFSQSRFAAALKRELGHTRDRKSVV